MSHNKDSINSSKRKKKAGLVKKKKHWVTTFNLPPAFTKEEVIVEKDPLEDLPHGKRIVRASIMWFLILTTVVIGCFPDPPSLPFWGSFLLSFAFAIYLHKGLTWYVFPASLRKWVMSTRIAFSCLGPEGAWTSKGLTGLTILQQVPSFVLLTSILAFYGGLVIGAPEFYTPVIDLDQMYRTTGTVERVNNSRGRRSHRAVLVIRTTEGELLRFRNAGSSADMKYFKTLKNTNEQITVWWQETTNVFAFRFFYKRSWQIKHGDLYLTKYCKDRVLRHRPIWKYFFYIGLAYFVFSLSLCWIVGNKYIKEWG
jgi:hypothetical protein